jgi:hypothetical protein
VVEGFHRFQAGGDKELAKYLLEQEKKAKQKKRSRG